MMQPKLRFPSFNSEWKAKYLKGIADVRDGTHDSPKFHLTGWPLVTSKNLLKTGKLDLENVSFISDEDFEGINKRSKVDVGDILFGMIGSIGNPVVVESNNFAIKNVALIKPEEVSSSYIVNYLRTTHIDKQFHLNQAGGTQKFIGLGSIRDLIINIPTNEEQQRIADFFTLLDRRIEQQQEKVEAWREYKKGMMQKLFSRELRFKDEDGKEFREWEESRLGDLGTTFTGLSGKTKEDFGAGEAEFVTFMNVFGNVKAKRQQTEKVDLSDGKKQNTVILDDLLFTTSSETPHEVGMASVWLFDEPNVYLNSFCFGFRLNNSSISSEFLVYMLRSEIYREKITLLAQGSTRFNLPRTGLLNMSVEIPESVEQQKISHLLSVIDNKVEMETKKVELLQEQKKGFMQQMFI